MTQSILAVPGLERLSNGALRFFWDICQRNQWDPDALAAVLSAESGFQASAGAYAWSPKRTASGLLQFIESTARGLGVPTTTVRPPNVREGQGAGKEWATWTVLAMTDLEQLPLVEAYYRRAFASRSPTRRVDYYLPAWGAWHGLDMGHVLATRGSQAYEKNRGLDVDGSGAITVSDLDQRLAIVQAKARGMRLDVPDEPTDLTRTTGGWFVAMLGLAGLLVWRAKRTKG